MTACREGVWVNQGLTRVPCNRPGDHEEHLGLVQTPVGIRTVRWSGPVGSTNIDPPEMPTWRQPTVLPVAKSWERPR